MPPPLWKKFAKVKSPGIESLGTKGPKTQDKKDFDSEAEAWDRWCVSVENMLTLKDKKSDKFLHNLGQEIEKRPALKFLALGYNTLTLLRAIVEGGEAAALALHWQLDRVLRECWENAGIPPDEALRAAEIAIALLSRTCTVQSNIEAMTPEVLAAALILENYETPDFRKILGVNRFDDVIWFNKEAFEEAVRLLETVRIPNARRVAGEYPFSLSGGMRQRAMIAMSLACEPKLLIADEPTTALDVTIQAQVLKLMNDLKERIDASIMFITHDLGVIAEMSDRVVIMYAGKIVETAPVEDLFGNPKHPYTQGLIASRPDFQTAEDRLNVIPGNVPDPSTRPMGCPFHPRCSKVKSICKEEYPPAYQVAEEHRVFCWEYDQAGEDRWKRAKENAMNSTVNGKEEAADE